MQSIGQQVKRSESSETYTNYDSSEEENDDDEEEARGLWKVLLELVESEKRFEERLKRIVSCFYEPMQKWVLETTSLESPKKYRLSSPTRLAVLRSTSSSFDDYDTGDASPRSASCRSAASDENEALTMYQLGLIFSNIQEIHTWSENLLRGLEVAIRAMNNDDEICRVLSAAEIIGCEMQGVAQQGQLLFSQYTQNFENALATLKKCNDQTRTFIRALELHPSAHGLLLEAYLTEPVQRTPRYQLLLSEAFKQAKRLHPNHSSCQELDRASLCWRQACTAINASVQNNELLEIMANAWNMPQLLSKTALTQRTLLYTGTLAKASSRRWSKSNVAALVFNDLFCFGSSPTRLRRHSYARSIIPLSQSVSKSPTKADVLQKIAPKFDTFNLQKAIPLQNAILLTQTTAYTAHTKGRNLSRLLSDSDSTKVGLDELSFMLGSSDPNDETICFRAHSLNEKDEWLRALVSALECFAPSSISTAPPSGHTKSFFTSQPEKPTSSPRPSLGRCEESEVRALLRKESCGSLLLRKQQESL